MVVAGYVVMRIALVALWIRAARQDPARRSICLTYAVTLSVAQIGWIGIMIVDASLVSEWDSFHTLLLAVTGAVLGGGRGGPRGGRSVDGGVVWLSSRSRRW